MTCKMHQVTLDLDHASRLQMSALKGEKVLQHSAHCFRRSRAALGFFCACIAPEADLGMQIAGDVTRPGRGYGCLRAQRHAPLPVADLELEDLGTRAACAES